MSLPRSSVGIYGVGVTGIGDVGEVRTPRSPLCRPGRLSTGSDTKLVEGQSAMGRFLARVAAGGTQVIIETHSDHVLNGVRRAVAADHSVEAEEVSVHFFGADPDPITLSISDDGSMSGWPLGFFDQTESDLAELARARRDD